MGKTSWIDGVGIALCTVLVTLWSVIVKFITTLIMIALLATVLLIAIDLTLPIFSLTYMVTWEKLYAVMFWVWVLKMTFDWFRTK